MKTKALLIPLFMVLIGHVHSQVSAYHDQIITCGEKVQLDVTTEAYLEIKGSNWTTTVNLAIYDSTGYLSVYTLGDVDFSQYPDNTFRDTLNLPAGEYTAEYDSWRPDIESFKITPKKGSPTTTISGDFIVDKPFDVANTEFSWQPNSFISDTVVHNPIVSPNETMSYFVKITEPGDVVSYDTVTITVQPLRFDLGKEKQTRCWDTVTLAPVNVSVYVKSQEVSWVIYERDSEKVMLQGKNSINSDYFLEPNTYALKITNNGPSSFDFNVEPLYGQGTGLKTNVDIGDGASITVFFTVADINIDMKWSPLGFNFDTVNYSVDVLPRETTQYVLQGTTDNGCLTSDTINVKVSALTVDAGGDKNATPGTSIQFDKPKTNYTGSDALTYLWTPAANLDDSTAMQPSVQVTEEAHYTVVVSTSNGCMAEDSVNVIVNTLSASRPEALGILQVYPNPVSEILTVKNVDLESSVITVEDIQGKSCKVSVINLQQINVSGLPTGIYFLKIINAEGIRVERFIKK